MWDWLLSHWQLILGVILGLILGGIGIYGLTIWLIGKYGGLW